MPFSFPRDQPTLTAEGLETATTATTLAAGRVGGGGGDILDAADLHAGAGKGAESGLGTGAGGLGAVTTSGTDLDVASEGLPVRCHSFRVRGATKAAGGRLTGQ